MSDPAAPIRIVAAVIRDDAGRVLLVRKRGAAVFQQPGGKRDAADADDVATLARELREELGVSLVEGSARYLWQAAAPAANEPGRDVLGDIYEVAVHGEPRAQAEIEALCWVDPACPGELVTVGLDRLAERLKKYYERGARFAKWRAVIDIGNNIPSTTAIHVNAHALARYAALCQAEQIVPIVEPEVLMDGDHDIDRCYEVTERVLNETFQQLRTQRVALEGMVLKPNMAVSGKKCAKQASVEEVAEKTIRLLKACVPAAVPGIAFLSGGQSDEDATAHLNAMNRIGNLPWRLTFSYGRALQAAPQKAWAGKAENVAAGQRAFTHRAQMNGLASKGGWAAELEKKAA